MSEWIDLSVRINDLTLAYPGDDPLKIEWVKSFKNDGFNLSKISTTMHEGTHIDFKKHLGFEDRVTFDQFIGPANVIFLKAVHNIIKTSDILHAYQILEKKEDILIISTGHETKFNHKSYFDFPKFDNDILDFLSNNNIRLFGGDLPSFEYADEVNLQMHKDLLSRDIYIIENLKNLNKLTSHIDFIALPLSIDSLEASMVRAIGKNK